jgi:hypothetical protein
VAVVDDELASLRKEFTDGLYAGYRFLAQHPIKYKALWFLDMVAQHGGDETARRLLNGSDASSGIIRLYEAGLLEHSVEAFMLLPRFGPLFTPDELARARERLDKYDFPVADYLARVGNDA